MFTIDSAKELVKSEEVAGFFTRMALGNQGPSMVSVGEKGCRVLAYLIDVLDEYNKLEIEYNNLKDQKAIK